MIMKRRALNDKASGSLSVAPTMKRKIAAIIAADIAGYSRLVEDDEEDTLRRFIAASAVFKSLVQDHYGRVFNTAGDAILAEFSSSVEAVRCAATIQARVRDLNAGQPKHRQLLFRIGISVGDVIEHESDLLGDGVNIAARLQTLATPGGLSISHWVHEQIAGKIGLEFRDAGWHNVRNIAKPVHVFLASIDETAIPYNQPPVSSRAPFAAFSPTTIAIVVSISALALTALLWPRAQPNDAAPALPPVAATVPALPKLGPTPASPPPTVIQPAALTPVTPAPSPQIEAVAPSPGDSRSPLPSKTVEDPKPDQPTIAAQTPPSTEQSPEASTTLTLPKTSAEPATEPVAGPKPAILPLPFPASPAASASRPRSATLCAEIRERAQLGDISSDERDLLRTNCR